MEFFAKKIVDKLVVWTQKKYQNEDLEVFYYGTICLLNSLATDLILLIWGLLTHTLLSTICWLFIFCIYRHHAGGLHATTNEHCIIASSILGISNWIALYYSKQILVYKILFFIICGFICLAFAPIESTKKELSTKQKLCEKLISLCIIVVTSVMSNYVPDNLSVSILYSLFVSNILILISILKKNKK